MKKILVLPLVCLLAAGCIVKKTSHTVYLEADGSVTWTVLETQVRSVEEKPAERRAQELEFLDGVASGDHPPIRVLEDLGAWSLDTRFLRRERPYTLLTEARFDSIDAPIRRAFEEVGLPAVVGFESRGGWSRLSVTIDVWALEETDLEDTAFTDALWEMELDDFQLLLSRGRFVDAANFSLEDEETRAVPNWDPDDEQVAANGGLLFYCLLWTDSAMGAGEMNPFARCQG